MLINGYLKYHPIKKEQAMPKTTDMTSKINLRLYVDLLYRASINELPFISTNKNITERRVSIELLKSGLISDGGSYLSGELIVRDVVITPNGALALEKWSSFLKEQTFLYKLGDAFIRFSWVMVGAIAATLSNILK